MSEEIILALKQRAKEMLDGNHTRKIGNEELYTIICEWENCYKEIEKQNKELEPIRELGIPVETAVAELNRLEDLEDDREQMQQIINELRKENKELQLKIYDLENEIDYLSYGEDL